MNRFVIFLLIFGLTFSLLASANNEEIKKHSTSVYVGGGFISKPTYEGSSSRRFMWIPMVALRYKDESKKTLTNLISLVHMPI